MPLTRVNKKPRHVIYNEMLQAVLMEHKPSGQDPLSPLDIYKEVLKKFREDFPETQEENKAIAGKKT